MTRRVLLFLTLVYLFGCDPTRTYQQAVDLPHGNWLIDNHPEFTFQIADTAGHNIYCDLRHTNAYPYSRIFLNYTLTDSLGVNLKKQLVSIYLFNPKDGTPTGQSGIGDIYSHRLTLLKGYKSPFPGSYTITFEQQMRVDTLGGIVSVGLRVERNDQVAQH